MAESRRLAVLSSEVATAAGQLASRLADSLSQSCTQLAKTHVLGRLGVILGVIAYYLRSLDSVERKISKNRTHKFLRRLEAICTWPNPPCPLHLDMDMDMDRLGGRIARRLLEHEHLTTSLNAWATSKYAENYIASFETFLPASSKINLPSLEDLFSDLELFTEEPIPDTISQLLFETITRHTLCLCNHSTSGSLQCIQGRLRLIEKIHNNQADEYLFDTAFITRTDVHQPEPLRCQLMRFQVPTTQQVASLNINGVPTYEGLGPNTLLAVKDLCRLVRHSVGAAKLCLKVYGNQLFKAPRPVPLGDFEYPVEPVPSKSLREVLREDHLMSRDRIVIAYILAKSVWQYYNTDWLSALWTTDNIHFMIEKREDDMPETLALNSALPYFAFSDGDRSGSSISESVDCSVFHRFPRILALGVILVELCRREARHHTSDNDTLERFINNNYTYSSRAINKDGSWPHLDLDAIYKAHFRDAVAVCFDWEKIDRVSGHTPDPLPGLHARRDLLWKEVVSPLQRICRVLNLVDSTGAIIHGNPHIFHRAHLYETMILKEESSLTTKDSQPHRSVMLGPALEVESPEHKWLAEITNSQLVRTLLLHTLRSSPHNSKPVRIAILDTGYDASNEFFTAARKRRIKWRDLVGSDSPASDDNPEAGQDLDGHGTDVLSMALRMAPFAEFYVARVFENSGSIASRSGEIAKAIEWAVNDHDVDIISMSFGFTEEQLEIRAAITEAHSRKGEQILFFAAAANEGANEPEMYPARDDRVIAVRATDYQGHWWRSNPPVSDDQQWSFMTLGQNMPSASRNEHVTGTSYATPIAAGFAAMILADARRLFTATDSTLLDTLSRHDGMRKVFRNRKLSVKTAPRCSYLNPMGFISRGEDERLAILRYAN